MNAPLVSRQFYAPAGLAFEDIEATARSVGSYYGERLESIEIAERYEGTPVADPVLAAMGVTELPNGKVRLVVVFAFAHDTRELNDGVAVPSLITVLADRMVDAFVPLGMERL